MKRRQNWWSGVHSLSTPRDRFLLGEIETRGNFCLQHFEPSLSCVKLVLAFVERGKPEYPEKNPQSKARTNNKLNPHMAPGWNRTRATVVGGERSQWLACEQAHL